MQQKRHLVLVPVVFLTGITAVAQPRPALLATTVKQDKDTTVMIRHVDGNVFDINSAETPPPILVIVRYKGRDYPQMTLTGGKDFPPWGFRTAFARDLNGDNKQEMIIGSFGSFGGSGGARYMTILSGVGESARLYTLPRGESENIHDSTFYLLKDKDGQPGIAITHPLMDGESRADATHWRVATYRLSIPKSGTAGTVEVVSLGEKRTAKRYSERLPDAVATRQIPARWRLVAPLL